VIPESSSSPILHAESPDGVLIAYRVHGDDAESGRPPVLLVHGGSAPTELFATWDVEDAVPLGDRFPCLSPHGSRPHGSRSAAEGSVVS